MNSSNYSIFDCLLKFLNCNLDSQFKQILKQNDQFEEMLELLRYQ